MGKNIWNRYEVPFWHSDREAPGTFMAYQELLSHWKFYALKFLNYTVIFLQQASARAPGPMWQATLKDSGSI